LRRFLVIGDLNVDIILSGMSEFPELGREIKCEDIRTVMGGSASIFACRLAQLGAKVDIFGKVGDDDHGRIVLNTLGSNGVGTKKVIVEDSIRTGVTVSLTYPKDKALITFLGCIGALDPSDIKPQLFSGYDHLHISSIYFQPKLLDSFAEVFAEAKRHGLSTSLDPQSDPLGKYERIWDILEYTDIFLPNEREARGITNSTSLEVALEKLSSIVQTVVVKCGSLGAVGKAGDRKVSVKGIKIDPVDTTGAGDSFNAGFIYYFLYKNKNLEASIQFATAVGALCCLYVGGAEGRITEKDAIRLLKRSA